MVIRALFAFLLLFSSPAGGTRQRFKASKRTTRVMRNVSRGESLTQPPPYLHLPVYVDSRLPLVEKQHFSPTTGTGLEPLPELVRDILLPGEQPDSIPPSPPYLSVMTSCKMNKMLVQVTTSVLGTGEPQSELKLGTCYASKTTRDYVYFEYELDLCGTKRTMINNQVVYKNTLQYEPVKLQGPIRRAAPFSLPVACYYNRYQYSYKVGYAPKMRMRKIFKPMKNRTKFILTPRNAQWERLLPSDQYALGEPMYFEVEGPSMSKDERLYVHSCYATPDKSHTTTPQFPVVTNFGCMIESTDGRSRFISYKDNFVRFSVDAFLFTGDTNQRLYMHCSMSVESSVPTATAKSCNYDAEAGRWVELSGLDSVCACCDSNCSSSASAVTKIISSKPWTVEPEVKPTKTLKRKTVFHTTTETPKKATTQRKTTTTQRKTTTTQRMTTPPPPKTTRKVPDRTTTSQPEVTAATLTGKIDDTVTELEWPFGGGGVKWVEDDIEEKQVKGSAVVEEEEEEEEEVVVTEPRRIFEDIFDFDE